METDSTAAKLPAKRAELNVENEEASTPSSPLDAGENVRGFLQVLGVFLIIFNVWGLTFAYGSFESFYALTYIPTFSASAIAWIGTIQSWLLIVSGLISGPLFDRGYFSIMIGAGAFLAVFGFMMLSLSHDYYAIFLSQGVCMGLGFGLLYIPSIALISRSFVRKRAVALGFATSGAPAGGIIYTVMFDQLISKLSFAWTVRIMAFLMLSLFLVAAFLLVTQGRGAITTTNGQRKKLIDIRALKDLPFWSFTAANFLLYLGYITPFYYIPTYAQTKLGTSRSMASYVLIISQACSIVGRVGTTICAHYFGSMVSWICCGILSGILCFAWISADTLVRFILFAAFYGGISGALIPLPPSVFFHVCPDAQILGTWLGMAQSISSFASLLGPPIAGALASVGSHSSTDLNFLNIQLFGGITMSIGAFELLLLWYLLWKIRDKKGFF
ncbi:hypothetical protein N7448_008519 [Penicillium atrosanguineum]|uniref:Uncharacterized protein n=1 Tax=Penicillium atrosanguineum TaxID=1132637 RepID=A0A9W9KZI3_9EURO|nr:uncharacterized protein N7443_000466 [Penicillium atrosanguineum]KAJ5127740.1 hypothetical protein N7448_008519 [Penicillium atrosanguineum]KAJ5313582.1 hypothetical protein N7443_000466 [Penicillium atrosanguineum]KAJ5330756.1 hypothetical protein N7476_000539 [Penicillium atrosanguineum]